MEPCMNPGETLTCHSPPPVFNVPKPEWPFPSPTTPTEPTTVTTRWTTSITHTLTTIVSEVTHTLTSTSEPSSTPSGSTTGITESTSHTKEPIEPPTTKVPTTGEPTEPGEENIVIIACSVAGCLVLILIILAIILYKKKQNDYNVPASSLTTQFSTIGLVGADEPDGKKKTDLAEQDTVCYKYDGNLTPENDCVNSPKVGIGDEDKPAPVVQMTEL